MTVESLARTDVVTADPGTPVGEVATDMRDEGVGSVVVVENDRPVGILTDRDLAIRAFTRGTDRGLTAEDLMTEDPVRIEADAGVLALTRLMAQEGVRRVPVVRNGRLVGIVTMDDLTRLLATELSDVAAVAESESPPY